MLHVSGWRSQLVKLSCGSCASPTWSLRSGMLLCRSTWRACALPWRSWRWMWSRSAAATPCCSSIWRPYARRSLPALLESHCQVRHFTLELSDMFSSTSDGHVRMGIFNMWPAPLALWSWLFVSFCCIWHWNLEVHGEEGLVSAFYFNMAFFFPLLLLFLIKWDTYSVLALLHLFCGSATK